MTLTSPTLDVLSTTPSLGSLLPSRSPPLLASHPCSSTPPRTAAAALSSCPRLPFAPKLVLILVIWSLTFASYCVYAFQDEYDSSYQVVDGSMTASTYKNLAIATCFFMSIYMLWTLILFCMVVFKSCALPVPYKWLFGLSSFTLLMVIIGTFVGIAYPVPSAAFIFVGFYGVINAYVWIMAIAWAPMDIDGGVLGHDAEVEMGNKQRPLSSSTSSTMNETASPFDQGAAEDNFSSLPEATDEERGASEFD